LSEKIQNTHVSNTEKTVACISTDGGKGFSRGKLPRLIHEDHPLGRTCIDKDQIFSFYGKFTLSGISTNYLYDTTNAQQNPKSVGKPAKLPTPREDGKLTFLFFNSDGKNGRFGGNVQKAHRSCSRAMMAANHGATAPPAFTALPAKNKSNPQQPWMPTQFGLVPTKVRSSTVPNRLEPRHIFNQAQNNNLGF
jgi:hypothetical protein